MNKQANQRRTNGGTTAWKMLAAGLVVAAGLGYAVPNPASAEEDIFEKSTGGLVPGPVVIDGSDTPWLGYWQGDQAKAEKQVVPVDEQEFKDAVQVIVHEPADPVWEVQVLSPNSTAEVAAGDVLMMSFWARAEPMGDKSPKVTAILQTDGGANSLTAIEPKLTEEWQQFEQQVTSEAAHGPDEIALVFHLGHVAQIVEIANPRMVKLIAE